MTFCASGVARNRFAEETIDICSSTRDQHRFRDMVWSYTDFKRVADFVFDIFSIVTHAVPDIIRSALTQTDTEALAKPYRSPSIADLLLTSSGQ